jgi:SAM-dependent methyltransferase
MLIDALSRIDLYCTACRSFTGKPVQHKLTVVPGEVDGKFVITGYLKCPNCGKQYPVLNGVPRFIDGVSTSTELLGQYLDAQYGTINDSYWKKLSKFQPGEIHLDIGCGTGRYTFECARTGFAIGIDANLEYLKRAAAFQRGEEITYKRKTRELAETIESSEFKPSPNVLFLLADVHNPPFGMDSFTSISALNLIDSVQHPLTVLGQADAMLKSGGRLVLSSPYCWDEKGSREWLETADTSAHDFLLQVLTGKRLPETGFNYRILQKRKGFPWRLRKHDTLLFTYSVDLIVAEKM